MLTRKWCLCIGWYCFSSLAPLEKCDLHPVISNIVSSFTFPGVFQPSSLQSPPKIQKNYPSSLFFSWSFHHPSLWGVFPANSSIGLFFFRLTVLYFQNSCISSINPETIGLFSSTNHRPRERRDIGFLLRAGDK